MNLTWKYAKYELNLRCRDGLMAWRDGFLLGCDGFYGLGALTRVKVMV